MSTSLQKAKLQEVKANKKHDKVGKAVDVQFNPASLRLKLSNQTEGGRSTGRPARQHNGANPSVLSMDLIFDTADEFRGDQPVSVREKTAMVEKYVLPKANSHDRPPLLQFQWDKLIITGIVESLELDFDHFAPNGVPLRAKCSISIKEQKPEYQYLQAGEGSRGNSNAIPPLMSSINQPGHDTNNSRAPSNRSTRALAGETAAELAARIGLDPSAWRGLDVDMSTGLTLPAGVEVGFRAGLSMSAGIGVSMGVSAGVGISLAASVGLEASVGTGTSVAAKTGAATAAGFAMSAAGGISAAIETVKSDKAKSAAGASVNAFSATDNASATGTALSSSSTVGGTSGQSQQARTPLQQSGPLSYTQMISASAAPAKITADPRSISYGYGAPLRPLYKTLTEQGQPRLCRNINSSQRRTEGEPSFSIDPTIPPWVQLPRQSAGRSQADAIQLKKKLSPCRVLYKG